MRGVGHMPMGDTRNSLPGVQEGILQHREVLGDQEGQEGLVVAQGHSWYEIPRLTPRFRGVQPDARNFLLAIRCDGRQAGVFPKQQEVDPQKTHGGWVVV